MTIDTMTSGANRADRRAEAGADAARYLVPLGRALFAAIFLISAPAHFTAAGIGYAAQQGVPMPSLLVPISGLLALIGGLSVLLGYRARLGAWLLVLFLLPVTLLMHRFWEIPDAMTAQIQMVMFLKNLSLIGGALLIAYFGPGPLSLDAKRDGYGSAGPQLSSRNRA
jgi:putative oxidoreductase